MRNTNIVVSTDKKLLQLDVIHSFLKESYWSKNIPIEIVKKGIENSLCFGVYIAKKQIGFARVITDFATFAYLADVFIVDDYRGNGYSKVLMNFIMNHEYLQGLRRFMLCTRDAQELYKQFGFTGIENPIQKMEIVKRNIYQ